MIPKSNSRSDEFLEFIETNECSKCFRSMTWFKNISTSCSQTFLSFIFDEISLLLLFIFGHVVSLGFWKNLFNFVGGAVKVSKNVGEGAEIFYDVTRWRIFERFFFEVREFFFIANFSHFLHQKPCPVIYFIKLYNLMISCFWSKQNCCYDPNIGGLSLYTVHWIARSLTS